MSPDIKPNFAKGWNGLLPAIAQDAESGQVLMLAWMNLEAWEATVQGGRAVYWSRSRNKLWQKGEQSGHYQQVREIFLDCDSDTILLKVHQQGKAACHTGHVSCFYRKWHNGRLIEAEQPVFNPESVYC